MTNLIKVGFAFRSLLCPHAFGAPMSRIAEHGIGFVRNFVGMAHKKNGAHVLSVRTRKKR
jgi:hypothetical protein